MIRSDAIDDNTRRSKEGTGKNEGAYMLLHL
jgi:hypothetical protein